MKKLLIKIGIDLILVSICIYAFKENSFIFGGIGLIYLGIVLYQYLNGKQNK